MTHTYIRAISPTTGEEVSIKDALKGRACDCICSACRKEVLAAKGQKNKHHFRHTVETNCPGMTPLHKLMQEIIKEGKILLTARGELFYQFLGLEVRLNKFYADAAVDIDDCTIYIEVQVTHDNTIEKIQYYKENKVPHLNINLSDLPHDISKEDLIAILNNEPERIDTQGYPKIGFAPKFERAKYNNSFVGLVAIVLFFIGLLFFTGKLKSQIIGYKNKLPKRKRRHYF